MLGAPVVSSGERNFRKINRAQFQDALFSLVAGLNLTQIQQMYFSDWLLCSPFFFFDWLISGTSRQNSRGFGETCLIPPWWGQRGQVMFARCGTLNSLEFFFSVRNTMCGGSAWLKTEMSDCHAQCVTLESPELFHIPDVLLWKDPERFDFTCS